MKIGFIGLGNVGGKLAGSLLRNGFDVTVLDLDQRIAAPLVEQGATWAESPRAMTGACELVITCLPNPAASAAVLEDDDGVLAGMGPGRIWMEMSTTDEAEVKRLGAKVSAAGGMPADCPVSGGCHRAATGNISIFAGCERAVFDRLLPVLACMGRNILHTGPLGSASVLKVITNYLATANLVSLCEALAVAGKTGMDLNTTYEAIRISSGNSFVHETESQVILNGSPRHQLHHGPGAARTSACSSRWPSGADVPLEISPALLDISADGEARYGGREWSPNIIRRLEEKCLPKIRADGFPAQMIDDEPGRGGPRGSAAQRGAGRGDPADRIRIGRRSRPARCYHYCIPAAPAGLSIPSFTRTGVARRHA
ncbi:MAG: NAD(P)-dependent oxidoreductase [Halofilum sp. (in: g-proteobacteria)]|nr:NAD(P)-dependent oxidoreductase [Halofilum sp. (in: g-proteobacteria)]